MEVVRCPVARQAEVEWVPNLSMSSDDGHGNGSLMDYADSALISLTGDLQVVVEAMVMRPREGEEAWEVNRLSSLQAPSDFSEKLH